MWRAINCDLAHVEPGVLLVGIHTSEVLAQMFESRRRRDLVEIMTANCEGLFSELARRSVEAPPMGILTAIDLSRVAVSSLFELRRALDRITSEAAAGGVRGFECFEGLLDVLRAELAERDARTKRLSSLN